MYAVARFSTLLQRRWRLAAMILLGGVAAMAGAQSLADTSRNDPPSRVARLSYSAGDVGFLPRGASNWSDARINRPLTTGDRLSSGRDARAELELGGGSLRIAGDTDLGLLDLNGQLAQFKLTQGSLELTVRELASGQSYEIDTPTVALVVDQPGRFRVDIQDRGRNTQVTAFDGNATVYGDHQAQRTILAGRRYRFDDSTLQMVDVSRIGSEDAFDYWSQDRDRRYARSNSRRYVSDQIVGYQDLNRYGDWQTSANYGAVWFPNDVGSAWAPYRDGHWVYIAPWGWTWVDDLPWGFAPYHYGRWVYLRRGWGWVPGPVALQPVYAPALVVFVGGGWSVGAGIAPIGWFPLGPGEIYNPWYRASRHYYTNINITNIHVDDIHGTPRDGRRRMIHEIDKHYRYYRDDRPYRDRHYLNRDKPHAFTAVPEKAFAEGRHIRREMLHPDRHQQAAARVLPDGTRLRPAPGSLSPPRSPHVRALPLQDFHRDVVAHHQPPRLATGVAAPGPRIEPAAGHTATLAPERYVHPQRSTRMPDKRVDHLGTISLSPRRAGPRPQPPRIERTAQINTAMPAAVPRMQANSSERPVRNSNRMLAPAGISRTPIPRFERVDRLPATPARARPRPTMAPRGPVDRPHHYQPPPRAAPRFTPQQPHAVRAPQPNPSARPAARPRERPHQRGGNEQKQ